MRVSMRLSHDDLCLPPDVPCALCPVQIRLLWEVLLYRQKGIGDTDAGQAALAALVRPC